MSSRFAVRPQCTKPLHDEGKNVFFGGKIISVLWLDNKENNVAGEGNNYDDKRGELSVSFVFNFSPLNIQRSSFPISFQNSDSIINLFYIDFCVASSHLNESMLQWVCRLGLLLIDSLEFGVKRNNEFKKTTESRRGKGVQCAYRKVLSRWNWQSDGFPIIIIDTSK